MTIRACVSETTEPSYTWRMQGLEVISCSSCWQGGRVLSNSGLAEVQKEKWGMGETVCIDINVLIRMNFYPPIGTCHCHLSEI